MADTCPKCGTIKSSTHSTTGIGTEAPTANQTLFVTRPATASLFRRGTDA